MTALSDGQWHRNMELKEKTKLSSRTLDKHLDKMKKLRIIQKKEDVRSGKYAVFFKAEPELTSYIKASISREEIANRMALALNETKDPLAVLEAIHASSQLYFIDLLERIQQNKKITNEEIHFFAECFLWANYKQYTSKLIEASHKIIDDLNITQSLINQAKRQMRVSEMELKIYEKIEQQKKNS